MTINSNRTLLLSNFYIPTDTDKTLSLFLKFISSLRRPKVNSDLSCYLILICFTGGRLK